jgi:hypothetical protein
VWISVSVALSHTLATSTTQADAASAGKEPISAVPRSEQHEAATSGEQIPAITPQELVEFCVEREQKDRRRGAVQALQDLFAALRGERVERRAGQNLLLNGGFEEWNASRPRCWNRYVGENSVIDADPMNMKSGECGLRIDLLDGARGVTIEQSVVAAVSCRSFELAGWIRRAGRVTFQVTVYTGESDSDWKEVFKAEREPSGEQGSSTADWTREAVGIPYDSPPGTADPQFVDRVKVSLQVTGHGTLWFDDLQLTPITVREMVARAERSMKSAIEEGGGGHVMITPGAPTRYWFPSGRVLDASSKEPVEGASVGGAQTVPVGGDSNSVIGTEAGTYTNSAGFFELREPVTQQTLYISADGYHEKEIFFEDGEERDLTILLERMTSVGQSKKSGRGESSIYGGILVDNIPYTGLVTFYLQREGAKDVDSFLLSLTDGQYQIQGLPEGSYRSLVEVGKTSSGEKKFELREAESMPVDYRLDAEPPPPPGPPLPPKVWVAGHVRDARTGRPVEGATIADMGGRPGSVSNSRGFFMCMEQIQTKSGIWNFEVSKPGYKQMTGYVDFRTRPVRDGRVTVEVRLRPQE